jgi:hypothetical protein
VLFDVLGIPDLLSVPRLHAQIEDDDQSGTIRQWSARFMDHARPGSANALSTLHGVEHKVGELDHHVLVELLALDLVVQLGGEHRLDEILSI